MLLLPMSEPIFPDRPSVALLHWLVRGETLKQNLVRAVRLWVWLRSLYGGERDELLLSNLPDSFTYAVWRTQFFPPTHLKGEAKPQHRDSMCPCNKTTADWLFDPIRGIPAQMWKASFSEYSGLPETEWEALLQEYPFKRTRRMLSADLKNLEELGCLKRVGQAYQRVPILPKRPLFNQADKTANSDVSLITLFQALDIERLTLLYPEVAPIAEELLESQQQQGGRRVFFHLDYVVPEERRDAVVDDHQKDLQDLWSATQTVPVQFIYHSASLKHKKQCLVYPVCIYYWQRAKYLCAYGRRPDGDINWYNYRLDRIEKPLKSLAWSDKRVPARLKQQYKAGKLTPEAIQDQMEEAWGFDFYLPSKLVLLRFDRDFHDRYIEGSFRHNTFEQITYEQAIRLVQTQTNTSQEQQLLLTILEARPKTDAYYQVFYRVGDRNVMMRLRAWRPRVEVFLPLELRQLVSEDVYQEWRLYAQDKN
jgi:CRISPR-associated protein (TIGR03985 family)